MHLVFLNSTPVMMIGAREHFKSSTLYRSFSDLGLEMLEFYNHDDDHSML